MVSVASSARRTMSGRRNLVLAAAVLAGSGGAAAWGQTWNGAGADNFWSTGGNWVGSVAPAPGGNAAVVFSGSARLSPTNTAAYSLTSLTVALTAGANAFSFSGGQLSFINGGLVQNSDDSLATFGQPFAFAGAALITTASTGGINFSTTTGTISLGGSLTIAATTGTTIQIQHGMTGGGSVLKIGSGTLVYTGTALSNTYVGATTVNSGLLLLSRSAGVAGNSFGSSVAGSLVVNGGVARLGAADQVADTSALTIGALGTFDLSTFSDAVGQLNVTDGSQLISSGGTLKLAGTGSLAFTSSVMGNTLLSAPIDFQGVMRTVSTTGVISSLLLTGGSRRRAGSTRRGRAWCR